MLTRVLTGIAVAAMLAGAAIADPLGEGLSAYYRGDYANALRFLRPLAEQGNVLAQSNLGAMYHLQYGVPRDDVEAAKWFRKAAEQGYPPAQDSLGFAFYYGEGLPQDYTEAVKWIRRAAEQGLANSQNKLGFMYEEGVGVPQDLVVAQMWFNLAGSQGFPSLKNRDRVAAKMDATQVAEAWRLAREWKPKSEN